MALYPPQPDIVVINVDPFQPTTSETKDDDGGDYYVAVCYCLCATIGILIFLAFLITNSMAST